ncbi:MULTISPECIES: hypothetical protein [unclassified Streptomyces]|uniref:hypothetical protein n=1 Tax=unclassified Streptomyces TaxID=2593676 RepID=UPI00081B83D7|nr:MULTISPECIES: hypothetical protein [unclassified Streptomyces]MYQ50381.1 hypothetical protein [Streptomyces sp. SID4941]SCD39061.1 Mce-associated membrane protein [Streptomyces sp. PalvLS-984]SDD68111.1 Mce-associated membrane protein [Streptomyces sp. AmelKG-A3]
MSTTRHLVNRRRRLAVVAATAAPPQGTAGPGPATVPGPEAAEPRTPSEAEAAAETGTKAKTETEAGAGAAAREDAGAEGDDAGDADSDDAPSAALRSRWSRPRVRLPAVLCAATVLLGAFAAWAFTSAASLRDDPTRQNTALTDISRTSEVKGQITEAVGAVFSYTYASPEKSEKAARTYLTGKAVQQHQDMLAEVRAQAPKQKLVLTTTVTESGVELLDGDRARLLVFADQSNTRTGKDEETTYAAAMFAVDAVRRGDTWRIAAIDTFTR